MVASRNEWIYKRNNTEKKLKKKVSVVCLNKMGKLQYLTLSFVYNLRDTSEKTLYDTISVLFQKVAKKIAKILVLDKLFSYLPIKKNFQKLFTVV